MNRRKFTALTCMALAAPRTLFAQTVKRVYRIAIFDDSVEGARDKTWRAFRDRLRELVLAEGNDVAYEARYARGASERLPELATELVALKPDVIVCPGTHPASVVMKSTTSIPIVFIAAGDPVGSGLVASLSRPGGNVTGNSNVAVEISAKQLELLVELYPGAKRFAYLTNAANKASVAAFRHVEGLAPSMHAAVRLLDGRRRPELERSFDTIRREHIQGLIVSAAGPLLEHIAQIVQFMEKHKLPVVYGRREYVDAGGLLSYSADFQRQFARGADYVNRILNGAKPADLPVEQATNMRMVLNLKTARTLGIRIPESVRLRVDEVIQ